MPKFPRRAPLALAAVGVAALIAAAPAAAAPGDQMNRVSVSSTGTQTRAGGLLELTYNGDSTNGSLSGNGRFTVFDSFAGDLVSGDTNFVGSLLPALVPPKGRDVFRHDNVTGQTVRVSMRNNNKQIVGSNSSEGRVSNNGRFVAFVSDGRDVGPTPPGGGGRSEIYMRDVTNKSTDEISDPRAPAQGLALTPAGSRDPQMSDDGSVVAFVSDNQLVPADDCGLLVPNCTVTDTYVWRRGQAPGDYEYIKGAVQPSISRNGRYLAFARGGRVFVRDLHTGIDTAADLNEDGDAPNAGTGSPSVSNDGNVVMFETKADNLVANDRNEQTDVFVADLADETVRRVSVDTEGRGQKADSRAGAISADGSTAVFWSAGHLLPSATTSDIYVTDLRTGETRFATQNYRGGGAGGRNPSVSSTGRYVAFESWSQSLVDSDTNGNTDVFLWDGKGVPAPLAVGPLVLAASDGGVFTYGGAEFHGSAGNIPLNQPVVGVARTESGNGYWLVASDGGVFSYGDAKFYGSTGNLVLNRPIVGMARTPSGKGYWLVASDGGVFSFGDAKFYGSTGNLVLNRPVVGMAANPKGGYWLVASDGGVFSFGTAFHGSAGNLPLVSPIRAMTATPSGQGYYLVAGDGGVFTYGDAKFYGAARGPGAPETVGLVLNPQGNGYRTVLTTGSVMNFTAGVLVGGSKSIPLNQPVIAVG